jgi:uncharacterized protein (TIGR00369 family)
VKDPEPHFRRLEDAYHAAPCNRALAPKLTVSKGAAEIRLEATPSMHHALGAVHGAFYFKLLDDAAFFAANSLVEDVWVLTASFSLEFLQPVVSGTLVAHGRVRRFGSSLIFSESRVEDAEGNVVGLGRGTFVRSKVPLGD